MLKRRILERTGILSPGTASPKGEVWEVVLIETGTSKNGFHYRPDVLKKAVPLFEGLPAKAFMFGTQALPDFNHLPLIKPGENQKDHAVNTVGFYKNARYSTFTGRNGRISEGIVAEFHILEGHKWLRENLKDAFSKGMERILGFSIDAEADVRRDKIDGRSVFVVENLTYVKHTDVVSSPSAGGQVLRLVASTGDPQMKRLLAMIMKYRPSWLTAAIQESAASDDEKVLQALEGAHQAINRVIMESIPVTDFDAISAATKAQGALVGAIRSVKEAKPEVAADLLEPWVSQVQHSASGYSGYLYPPKSAPAPAPTPAPAPASVQESVNTQVMESVNQLKRELAIERNNALVTRLVTDSGLPKTAQIRLIESLSGREDTTETKVRESIEAERNYISNLSPTPGITGLGGSYGSPKADVKMGKERLDKLQEAMDMMFNAQESNKDGIRAFRSLKEAWAQYNPHGTHWDAATMSRWIFEAIAKSFPPNFANATSEPLDAFEKHQKFVKENWNQIASVNLKEAVTSSEFTVAFGTSFLKRMVNSYTNDPRANWRQIVSPSFVNLQDATRTFELVRMGDIPILPRVAERDAYLELIEDPTEAKENLTPYKYGGIYSLTWESVMVDDLGYLRKIPFLLGRSANLRIARNVFSKLEDNVTLNATSAALISSTHNNLITGNPALAYNALISGTKLFRNQTSQDANEKLGLSPRLLLCGPEKEAVAWELTASDRKATAGEDSTLKSYAQNLGLTMISTVELGRAAGTLYRWYMLADPAEHEGIVVGFLGGRSTPDIFVQGEQTPTTGQYFTNDIITFKIRLVMGSAVADYRPFVGSHATS